MPNCTATVLLVVCTTTALVEAVVCAANTTAGGEIELEIVVCKVDAIDAIDAVNAVGAVDMVLLPEIGDATNDTGLIEAVVED